MEENKVLEPIEDDVQVSDIFKDIEEEVQKNDVDEVKEESTFEPETIKEEAKEEKTEEPEENKTEEEPKEEKVEPKSEEEIQKMIDERVQEELEKKLEKPEKKFNWFGIIASIIGIFAVVVVLFFLHSSYTNFNAVKNGKEPTGYKSKREYTANDRKVKYYYYTIYKIEKMEYDGKITYTLKPSFTKDYK